MNDINHIPFRYNLTTQWSDRYECYISFATGLLNSAKMFAPSTDLIGKGSSPEQAIIAGYSLAREFLKTLNDLAILPPREEITPTYVSASQEQLTAQPKKRLSNGHY